MENYPIVWSDSSKTADDTANANANAMLNWNEDTKKATVTKKLRGLLVAASATATPKKLNGTAIKISNGWKNDLN